MEHKFGHFCNYWQAMELLPVPKNAEMHPERFTRTNENRIDVL